MADEGDAPSQSLGPTRENALHIESDDTVQLLPGMGDVLKVRYTRADGTPLGGRPVDFDLSDTLSGASLSPAQAETDDDGYAEASLHAGTTTAMFSVRVTAEGADDVSFAVIVTDALAPTARVGVAYEGARDVSSVSLTLVPDADCAKVSTMTAGVGGMSQVIYSLDEEVEFQLGAGRSYALIAGARDDTNAKLGSGCSEFMAPTTAIAEQALVMLEVPIEDVQLALGKSYAITLGLDVQKPLALLAPAAANAVSAALPSSPTSAATFYLNAVQAQLASADAAQLQGMRGTLDPALQALLDSAQSGPQRLASELSGLISALGGSCSIQASYTASGEGSFRVDRLFALPSPALDAAAKQVELSAAGALSGAAVLDASYDEASATLQIDALSLQLGLGSYASLLLDGARSDPASFTARVGGAHGCASVGTFVSSRSLPVAPAVAVAACEQAAAGLIDRIDSAWRALDAAHPSIWLSGPAAVHDRNDDGVVDDLGPADLGGSWSTSASGAAADKVKATLRVPAVPSLVAL